MLVLTPEASYHAPFDGWTAAFLRQAGVDTEFLPLEHIGINGNGHLMMLERNSDAIADYLDDWLCSHVS